MIKQYTYEDKCWFWLSNIETIGRKTRGDLLEYFGNVNNIYEASENEIYKVLPKRKAEKLILGRDMDKIEKQLMELEKRKIVFYSPQNKEYPKKLKFLQDYPTGIYVKGKLPDETKKTIAIVGARNGTYYGREMAEYFARELVSYGYQIVSGLARGVDAAAHKGALDSNGYTLGVLGCGINICYPKENYNLYHEMEISGGVLSEYGLYVEPKAGLFPVRNRLISALADGILVTEAREKSGSLITVDQGLEMGKDIFAIPGKTFDSLSKGCNQLIKFGAKLVTEPVDIVSEYQSIEKKVKKENKNNINLLVMEEKKVYSCLSLEPKYIEYIIEETGFSVQKTLSILFSLENRGYIKQVVKNYYSICQ